MSTPTVRDLVCFIDLETGGREPRHPTIQVGAIAVDIARDGWPECGRFEAKVRFDPELCEPEALALNHYDEQVWAREAIGPSEVLRKLDVWFRNGKQTLELISQSGNPYRVAKVAGHNIAKFDLPRLERLWREKFKPFAAWRPLDTLVRAAWQFDFGHQGPKPDGLSLGALCEFYGIEHGGAHEALADILATIEVAKRLVGSAQGLRT